LDIPSLGRREHSLTLNGAYRTEQISTELDLRFSIARKPAFTEVWRKVLTPNDFSSLQEVQQRLLSFQSHYERSASPFNWTFTRRDLHALLAKIAAKRLAPAA